MMLAAVLFVAGFVTTAPPEPTPRARNPAADELARSCAPLGIDFDRGNPDAPHPSKGDAEARERAGYAGWLDAQIQAADETIAPPAQAFQDYLESRKEPLWNVVAFLEKTTPEWPSAGWSAPHPELLGVIALEKLLLAAALAAERDARPFESARLLDAAWSLSSSVASRPDLISQLIAVATMKLQAGALRKVAQPPMQWLDRLSGNAPWGAMLDAFAAEGRLRDPSDLTPSGPDSSVYARAFAAAADAIRPLSPCELSRLPDAEVWRPAYEEMESHGSAEVKASAEVLKEILSPNLSNSIRRAARLEVDREVTLTVLQLRLERAASRDGRWPTTPRERPSSVCPGVSYVYESDGEKAELRFSGEVDAPASGPMLPLSFKSAAPTPTPTPTPTPAPPLTPAPAGGMIGAR